MKRLTRNNRQVRRNGKKARAGCKSACCDPGAPAFFYAARRCDTVTPPPIPLPIPDTVPTVILIPGPWGCPGEPCEIAGKRLVLYGGYCYVIDEDQPEAFQNPPCGEHLKPRRYLPGHFDPQPPIVDPAQLTCKPLGELCSSDCIPQAPPGSCCTGINCTGAPPDWPIECMPCECPVFHRYALQVQWTGTRTHRDSQTGLVQFVTQTQGNGSIVYDCDNPEAAQINGTETGTCTANPDSCGPTACADVGYPYNRQIEWPAGIIGFGDSPVPLVASKFPLDLSCSGLCGGYVTPVYLQRPCSGTETIGTQLDFLIHSKTWSTVANCFGGQYTGSFITTMTASTEFPGRITCEGTATIAWTWVPLVRCADDPNPILDVPEAYRPGVRKALNKVNRPARLSFRDIFRLITGGL